MQRDLVIRATTGDHDAFSELARAAVGGITRVAFLILRDADLASDAVQDALIAAWRDIRGLRDPDRFEAWLYRLTVRSCYRAAHHQRRKSTMEVELLPSHDAFVDDDQRLLAIRDQLERGFRRLSPDERAVLVLRYYLDLPLADAAAVLGIPIGTMKSRLNRASAALRAAIDAHERSTALANGGAA
jgi:RNA polymerase sigma-70 factor (ECF subfamily)